ncbi:MAG TPA: SpoIIE family protein phosphatase [Thermoanaerobaculia bacterium]|nr:SpoIIE family protein phosphatase [Thermoanaerobaculia bacterium]
MPANVRFMIYQPNLTPLEVTLPAELITLGRAMDCTIPLKDRYLSRRHAEIVFQNGSALVRDCGSVNGTMLNGQKLTSAVPLHAGDKIVLGDTEVVFEPESTTGSRSQLIALDSTSHAKNLAIPLREAVDDMARAGVLASLAVQFIEDRPMEELFEFILDRVMSLLKPSRAALAFLGADGKTFDDVRLRRHDEGDSNDLMISRTLLADVIEGRCVISFVDSAMDERLAKAQSIIGQHIRSAVCAPLLVGDQVLGVLYLDFLASQGDIPHDDVRLIAQIASLGAAKLETTRLREEAILKAKIDEELRTAYAIQSRLLPATLPAIEGYAFAGTNKPCKTVSGDYFDVLVRPSGKIYFVIADVSGKGITAALVMSSLATAFNIFTRTDPTPAELVAELNVTLAPKTAPTKFVTLVAGVLDPSTGVVEFANAGHVPPLVISSRGVEQLKSTDMVVGLFTTAKYRNQSLTLAAGDSLVLFTDGVTEAENEKEDQLGLEPVAEALAELHGATASQLLATVETRVQKFIGATPAGDDVTMLAVSRAM